MSLEKTHRSSSSSLGHLPETASPIPGKRTLAEQLPAQARMEPHPPASASTASAAVAPSASTHRLESLFHGGAAARAIQLGSSAQGPDDNATSSPVGQGRALPVQLRSKMEGALG